MIIGEDFNFKSRQVALFTLRQSAGKPGVKISVDELNNHLGFDEQEIKNILDFLLSQNYLKEETIGGALLYGHVSITEKGIARYSSESEKA